MIIKMSVIPGGKMGKVGKINVKVGDKVAIGDILAQVETGKGNRPVKAACEGSIHKIYYEEGADIASNAEMFEITENLSDTGSNSTDIEHATPEKEKIVSDLLIIGGGPGGYVSAIYAAKNGLKVTLVEKREVKNSLYIIITSDSGLSGSYNSNILAKALKHMNQGKNEKIVIVGAKGNEYFKRQNKNIIRTATNVADAQVYYGAQTHAKWLKDFYLTGEVDEVFIAYTHFESVLSYVPCVEKILPIPTNTIENPDNDKKYEPDMDTFIEHFIPLYLHMNLFRAFSESHTSEQAARMVNMDAAEKNASEIIEDLNREYNRKRQATITQELSEIIGSADILNKGGNT